VSLPANKSIRHGGQAKLLELICLYVVLYVFEVNVLQTGVEATTDYFCW